jgi:3-oxoisoapionate kinase
MIAPSPPALSVPTPNLLLAYYGDDFTGSTDVMEALMRSGLRTVLFLEPPNSEQLGRFPNLRAYGVAGASRTMAPAEMERELAPIFTRLRESGAPLVHYKTCSTFDSSPEIGSIGKAIEIGRSVFQSSFVPLLVGAPILGRYSVFGNLFARSGLDTEPFRLDRHPAMSRHPITPMTESDLRLHLSRQTDRKIALFDVLRIESPNASEQFEQLIESGAEIVLFDVLNETHLARIGELIWKYAGSGQPRFIAGSSGVEYALTAHWKTGIFSPEAGQMESVLLPSSAGQVDQLLVLSGSCSPVTGRQMNWAFENGFADVPLEPHRLIDPAERPGSVCSAVQGALELLRAGRNVILHTSRGPQDARVEQTIQRFIGMGLNELDIKLRSGPLLGPALGAILREVLEQFPMRRVVVAGGDTSSYVAREIGIEALEMIIPMAPGSPLCKIHAAGHAADGLEIMFKGGQVGKTDLFGHVLAGTTPN